MLFDWSFVSQILFSMLAKIHNVCSCNVHYLSFPHQSSILETTTVLWVYENSLHHINKITSGFDRLDLTFPAAFNIDSQLGNENSARRIICSVSDRSRVHLWWSASLMANWHPRSVGCNTAPHSQADFRLSKTIFQSVTDFPFRKHFKSHVEIQLKGKYTI